ncbi:hypothetical protein TW79_14125 [Tritonibacter mobilis]|uniref:Uncharacterized protein n=1 Tax=Tritonibacter mobilis F1926 TaxID=1265309 RepID=A0A1B1A884_9RHOB|nr:hypothetical protein K529_018475 [Tritonibacter mobilis F1926]KJZ23411.1 hypothetical protein TW79_14125 [Tritonibacter mobilis]
MFAKAKPQEWRSISDANRRAFALRALTPFHVTDVEVARADAALHYPLRSDEQRLGYHRRTSCDAEFNPFVVPDFMRIDARQVFSREIRT